MGAISKYVGYTICRTLSVLRPVRGIPVLAYHSIDASGSYTSIAPGLFRAQMDQLSQHGVRTKAISEVIRMHQEGVLPADTVALTFDDGLVNFMEQAWPIMQEFGHNGTVYVPTDFVGGEAAWCRSYGLPVMPILSWDQLGALAEQGVDVQNHGCSHRDLTVMSDAALKDELVRSSERIGEALGYAPDHFCYPFGAHDARVVEATRQHGFHSAVTTVSGRFVQGDDPLAIRRDNLDMVELHGSERVARLTIDACLDGSYSHYIAMRDGLKRLLGRSGGNA